MTSPLSKNNTDSVAALSESAASPRIVEDSPRIQATFLFGLFGTESVLLDEEKLENVRKRLLGRIKVIVNESGGQFQDLGLGRFSATLGVLKPSEEDPLTAVTIGLKLLQLAAVARKTPPLRLVAVTGRVASSSLQLNHNIEDDPSLHGHELLNRSLRIMEECPPGALYADGLTYRMIRGSHQCSPVETASQASLPVAIYEVTGTHDGAREVQALPLIGRQKESNTLKQVFSRVAAGEGPSFLTISGDLGMGKTHLLKSFLKGIGDEALIFYNRRQRRRIDRWRRTPYSYFGEVLRAGLGISEHDDAATSLDKLLTGLLGTLPPEVGQVPQEFAIALGLLCYIEMPEVDELLRERELKDIEQEAFSAFGRYLEAVSENKPVVFALDDLYSADPSSLRLFRYLMTQLDAMPVMFVFSSRQSLLKEMETESDFKIIGERITLKPLSRSASEQLFTQLLPDGLSVNFPLARRILDLSDGNPFFLQESIRELSEQRAMGESSNIEIPGSIEGILQSRLSRLSRRGKSLLQYASVFGKIFWRGGVEMLFRRSSEMEPGWRIEDGMLTSHDDDLIHELSELINQGLLREQEESLFEGETQYVFVPGLLQELVYQEIKKEVRAPCHRLAAQWLKVVSQRSSVNIDADIAFHFEEGDAPFKAARVHLKFGNHLFKVNEPLRSIEHFEKSLQLMAEDSESRRVEAHKKLAEAYIMAGRYEDALVQLEHVLMLSWSLGSRVLAGEAFTRKGWVFFLARKFSESLACLKNGYALHQVCHYERGVAMALSNMGKVYTVLGDYKQAELYLQEALMLRRDLGQSGDVAWTLNDMANLLVEKGELRKAMSCHKEALEIRKALSKPRLIIQSMSNMSALHMMLGEDDAALADLIVTSNIAQKLGDRLSIAVVTVNIGELYLLRGDTAQAERYLRQATTLAEKLDDKLILAECYRLMGELSLEKGEAHDSLDFSHRSFGLVKDFDIGSALASTFRLMGEVYAVVPLEVLQDFRSRHKLHPQLPTFLFGDALACLEESITVARQHGNLREEAKSRMVLGLFEVNRGQIKRGRRELEQCYEAFGKLGMERYHSEVGELINDVLVYQQQSVELDQVDAEEPPAAHENTGREEPTTADDLPAVDEPLAALQAPVSVGETVQIKVDFEALQAEFDKEPQPEKRERPLEKKEISAQSTQIIPSPRPDSFSDKKAQEKPQKQPIKVVRGTPVQLPTVTPEKADEVLREHKTAPPDAATRQAVSRNTPRPTVAPKAPPFPPLVPPAAVPAAPLGADTPPSSQPGVLSSKGEAGEPGVASAEKAASSSAGLPAAPAKESSAAVKAVPLANVPSVSTSSLAAVPAARDAESEDELDTSTQIVSSPRRRQSPLSSGSGNVTNPFDSGESLSSAKPEEEQGSSVETPAVTPSSEVWDNKTVRIKAEELRDELEKTPPRVTPTLKEESAKSQTERGGSAGSTGGDGAPAQAQPAFAASDQYPAVPRKGEENGREASRPAEEVNFLDDDLSLGLDSQEEPTLAGRSVDVEVRPDPSVPQTPSVYDSQVIIAQVAEDDPISRDWFEQARSDRVEQFWESNSVEVEKVKEEILLEQMMEEIDEIDETDKTRKRKK